MAVRLHPLPTDVFPPAARPHIARLNAELRDLFGLEGSLKNPLRVRRSDLSIARRGEVQVDVSRITPSIVTVVSGSSTVVGTPNLTFGQTNTVGSTTTALSVNSALAIFGLQAPAALAATAAVGTSAFAARADHVHLFPAALRSTANGALATISDDGTDMTWTTSLGGLMLAPAAGTLGLPAWTAAGALAMAGTVLSFNAQSNNAAFGTDLATGINAQLSRNDGSTYSNTLTGFKTQITNASGGPSFVNASIRCIDAQIVSTTHATLGHTWTERSGLVISMGIPGRISGSVVVTDQYGIKQSWTGGVGTITLTNARAAQMQMPTCGAVIRRGYELITTTINVGTAAVNAEGYYCEDLTIGTTRTSFFGEGATTGTPTLVQTYYAASHAVGTSRYSFFGASDTAYFGGICQVGGAFRHLGAQVGLYGTSSVAQSTGWSASGFTASKTLNGNSFTLNELMSFTLTLATRVQDLGAIAA